ncbi:uncharacterized protein LOC141898714 isoform X2 [Tubulanus polymorphus]|uniref:uncharacterized protein LOC141898714 isoform X2 n=1 Tax=Tubulanus polymorphus TaxID=672921 RepID=UPI003DA39280
MPPYYSASLAAEAINENESTVSMAADLVLLRHRETVEVNGPTNAPCTDGCAKLDKQNNIVKDINRSNGDALMTGIRDFSEPENDKKPGNDAIDAPVHIRIDKGTSSSANSTPSKSTSSSGSRSSAPIEIPSRPITETVHLSLPGAHGHQVHPAAHKRTQSFGSQRPKYDSFKSIPEVTAEARLVLEQYLQRSFSHSDLSPPLKHGAKKNELSIIEEKSGYLAAPPAAEPGAIRETHSDSGADGSVSRNRRPSYATATENLFFPGKPSTTGQAEGQAINEERHTPDSLEWDLRENIADYDRRNSFSSEKESSDEDQEKYHSKKKKNYFKRAQQRIRESFRRRSQSSGLRTPDSDRYRSITPSVTTSASGEILDDNMTDASREQRFQLVSPEVSQDRSFFMSIWRKLRAPSKIRKSSLKKRNSSKSSSSHSDAGAGGGSIESPVKARTPTEIFEDVLNRPSSGPIPSDSSSIGRPTNISRPVSRSGSQRSMSSLRTDKHRPSVHKQHSFRGRCSYAHSHSHSAQGPDRSTLSLPGLVAQGGHEPDIAASNKEARRRALRKQLEENAQSDGIAASKPKTPDGVDGEGSDSGSSPEEKRISNRSLSEQVDMYAKAAEKLDNIADRLTCRSPLPEPGPQGGTSASSLEKKIAEVLRNKGDNMHQSMIPTDAIVQLVKHASYRKFKKVLKNQMRQGENEMAQIALLFEVTRVAVDFAGHGGALAMRLKEMSLKYFEDKFANWVIGQGGWDSVIESEENEEDEDQGTQV